jgi:nucleoside-diphosphate-sugar epimerase
MRVGVTGASGFIGSALVRRHLAAGDPVTCLVHRAPCARGATAVPGDLTAPDERLKRFADGLDVLYHCAGELRHEAAMHAVNVDGTRALVAAASGAVGRFVQLSSTGVYGSPRHGRVAEDAPLEPRNTYERTKAAADRFVLDAAREGQLASVVVLRPSIVFGEGMANQSLFQLIRVIDRGMFFFVGRPGASANYVHVSDVVDALVLCGTSPAAQGRVYNLSDWCTVEDLASAIADALGQRRPWLRLPEWPVRRATRVLNALVNLPLTESRIDALVSRCTYSMERIRQDLGFGVAVPIAARIGRMVKERRAA